MGKFGLIKCNVSHLEPKNKHVEMSEKHFWSWLDNFFLKNSLKISRFCKNDNPGHMYYRQYSLYSSVNTHTIT